MSQLPTVSLVIVSRKRQQSLRRTLSSLRFQSFENFEVIVVSDAADGSFLNDLPFAENITHFHFGEANISAARNVGIAASCGDIIAFCDDDAVPDPCWLERLIVPFGDPQVASSGGFVRGRNGIEFQWRALLSDDCGDDIPITIDESASYVVIPATQGRFAKLQGTNCAFRKSTLTEIEGFDEGFRFFLDETDVCLRLARRGYESAFVPSAQVHHGFAQSDQRSGNRVPKTLYSLGVSKRRFLTKHADPPMHNQSFATFMDEQRTRLIEMMVDGRIEPKDLSRLLGTLKAGFEAVVEAVSEPLAETRSRDFLPLGHSRPTAYKILAGSSLSRKKLMENVTNDTENQVAILVMIFSLTSLFHRREYDVRGFWVQIGGIFGKSKRVDPILRILSLAKKAKFECDRVHEMFPGAELWIVKVFRNLVLEKTKSHDS